MNNIFKEKKTEDIKLLISKLQADMNPSNTRRMLGNLDFTSLNITDSISSVSGLCDKINNYSYTFPDLPVFAAFCVYPRFVPLLKKNLNPPVKIASVAAGFPSSQSSIGIKTDEVRLAIDEGADEIDIVMPVGEFLDNRKEEIRDEIASIKEIMGKKILKVIIESGTLAEPELIYDASILSLEAGADFIKTSTGKEKVSASLEAVYVMSTAIRNFYHASGKKRGIKAAGGISGTSDALAYYSLVEMILGKEWLLPEYFRIGASRLANNLLGDVEGRIVQYF